MTVAAGPRAVVRGDLAALRRLFSNLIENAVRYGERARLAWALHDGKVDVTVEDDGRGFDRRGPKRRSRPSSAARLPGAGRPAAPGWAWRSSARSPKQHGGE